MCTKRLCVLNRMPVSKKRGSAAKDERSQHLKFFFFLAKFLESVVCEHCSKSIYVCCVCLFSCAFVHMLVCHISDNAAFLPNHSSSPFISPFSLQQKKVLHDPLMQDYWIKEQGSCTNLPH